MQAARGTGSGPSPMPAVGESMRAATPTRSAHRAALGLWAAFALSAVAPASLAQPAGGVSDERPGPLATAHAALQLAEFGLDQRHPLALVAAARVLRDVGLAMPPGAPLADGGPCAPVAPALAPAPAPTAPEADAGAQLLAEARFAARGDVRLLALIATAEAHAGRAPLDAFAGDHLVMPGAALALEHRVGAGSAEAMACGPRRGEVALAVSAAHVDARCAGAGALSHCAWRAARPGTVTITLRNRAEAPALIRLFVHQGTPP